MKLLNGFFKRKKLNLFEIIAYKIENEEKKKALFDSPFINKQQLTLNYNGILSFVIAVFYYEVNFNSKFKEIRLKKEYSDIIEKRNSDKSFQLFYNYMVDYSKGVPNLDKALWNITYTYLHTVWGIEKTARDPILLTVYSVYLTEIRITIKEEIIESLPLLVEKDYV